MAVILLIIVTNTVIGFKQEYSAERTMEALKHMSSPTAKVLRDTMIAFISSREVVPGDVLLFEEGDIIPADGRLFETFNFDVDEALLTGESLPINKKLDIIANPDQPMADRINLVYSSTTVTRGRGKGICFVGLLLMYSYRDPNRYVD